MLHQLQCLWQSMSNRRRRIFLSSKNSMPKLGQLGSFNKKIPSRSGNKTESALSVMKYALSTPFRSGPITERRNAVPFVIESTVYGCGWCESKCPVRGASAIRINIIGEVRLASGSYVEKAREYGFVFKARDNSLDRLAPGTFDVPGVPAEKPGYPGSFPPDGSGIPPGFLPK